MSDGAFQEHIFRQLAHFTKAPRSYKKILKPKHKPRNHFLTSSFFDDHTASLLFSQEKKLLTRSFPARCIYPCSVVANASSIPPGNTFARMKLKGIDGGPHKLSMWFNLMQSEEPYRQANNLKCSLNYNFVIKDSIYQRKKSFLYKVLIMHNGPAIKT